MKGGEERGREIKSEKGKKELKAERERTEIDK